MDLGIDINDLTRPGRKVAAIRGQVVREVSDEDLATLAEPGDIEARPLKRLGERHHALARMLARGEPEGMAAAMLGYTPARISILKASPAFRELLALYSDQKDAEFVDFVSRAAGLATDTVVALQERLEEDPDAITTGQLVEILKATADRSGNGPTSTQNTNVSVDLGARLKAARERVRGPVIDAEVLPESDD